MTLGRHGAFVTMKRDAVFVDHTTASAGIARELATSAQKRGLDFVDAPVSGGEAGAVNGKLTIMCGGTPPPTRRPNPSWLPMRGSADSGTGRLRPAHQDGQSDLYRRHRAGAGGRL